MSDWPVAVVKLWAQAVDGAIEVGRTYYKAMTETLMDEQATGANSGEGDVDAMPRANATTLSLSDLTDDHGNVHVPTSSSLAPASVGPSTTFTAVKVKVGLPASCTTSMLRAKLLDDAGATASDEFTIFVSMPE